MFVGIDLSPGSSALVALDGNGSVAFSEHFSEELVKRDLLARFRMAERVFEVVRGLIPTLVAIEDYDLNPTQQVAYQIAEVGGILKYKILDHKFTMALIHNRKLKSYVLRERKVPKSVIVAWAEANGFPLPPKKPGKPGLYARQRQDLADAFVLAKMARELNTFLSEGTPPVKGHLLLDPVNGVAFRPDLLFNNWYAEENLA